jgi:cytochrome c2
MLLYANLPAEGSEIEKGKKIYEERRCGVCHALGGQGGKVGPDLWNVANRHDRDWLVKFFKDPKGTVPGAKMFPVKATDEELAALVEYLLSLKK